jgi:hypothetical protein
MRVTLRLALPLMAAAGLGIVTPAVAPAASAKPHVCKGTSKKPGVLVGTYASGVVVKGFCTVSEGKAKVIGTLTVTKGSAFAAAFGLNDKTHKGTSSLTVTGNVIVNKGATAVLGCKVNPTGSGFPCIDDPNPSKPTLTSAETIKGSLIENAPLGVVVHNSKIGGSWTETGGGGGVNCTPTGPFQQFKSPVYSDLEDSTVGGNVTISSMKTCWVGLARVHVKGNAKFTNNELQDPDGIEIVSNHIDKNLACTGNSHPASDPSFAQPVWDSGDLTMNLYPRQAEPNTVGGKRSGQCVLASPTTQGGPLGPGAF